METAVMHQSQRFTVTKSPCLLHHHHHHQLHHHHHHHHHLRHLQHHHHFQHHHHHCALHCHPHLCPSFASPTPPQNLQPLASPKDVNPSVSEEPSHSGALILLQEQEHKGLDEEDDEEPVFVLTDEWMEFFAKSEAKRKSEKKQAKKRKN